MIALMLLMLLQAGGFRGNDLETEERPGKMG